jgi:hypothetical protein
MPGLEQRPNKCLEWRSEDRGRKEGMEGGREEGRKGGRKKRRVGGRKGGRDGGRERRKGTWAGLCAKLLR